MPLPLLPTLPLLLQLTLPLSIPLPNWSHSPSLPQHYHPHYPKYFNQSSTPPLQPTQYNQQVLHLLYFINQLYVSTVRAILPVRTSPCFLTLNPECTFCHTFDQIIRTLPRSLLLILSPTVSEITLNTKFCVRWNRLLVSTWKSLPEFFIIFIILIVIIIFIHHSHSPPPLRRINWFPKEKRNYS